MSNPLIKARDLTKIFNEDPDATFGALDKVNLDINEKEIVGVSGASGSGKTTLLSILGCLETPTSGTLELFGRNVENLNDVELSEIRLRHIGFIFQEHNLIPALTVQENIELPLTLLRVKKSERKTKVSELLKIVELEDLIDRYPSQLSRGQRQRIAAVRAFTNEPKIVLADEPTSDLDKGNAGILLDFLKQLNRDNGTTIVIAATDPEEFQDISSRNMRLVEGKIVN